MKLKILSIAALSLALIGGVAQAQTTSSTPTPAVTDEEGDPGAQQKMWAPFYTDNTFSAVRPVEEMRSAFMSMSADDQAAMKAECATSENKENFWPEGAVGVCTQIGTF